MIRSVLDQCHYAIAHTLLSHHHSCSRKLSREKTIANFEVLWPFTKVFFAKLRDMVFFGGLSFPPISQTLLLQSLG